MKNKYLIALLCMCAASFALGGANASPLVSETEVKHAWENRLKTGVDIIQSGTHNYRSKQGGWPAFDRLADAGYLELEKRRLSGLEQLTAQGMDSAVTVRFTEKLLQETIPLSASPSLTAAGMARIRCMVSFNRRLDRVIDISPGGQSGESIVLVAGTYPVGTSSDIYQAVVDDYPGPTRYRYRLTFRYDPFLEQHRLTRFEVSPWEQEEWKAAQWLLSEDGKRCIHTR